MKLAELQSLLWAAIRWPTGVDAFLAQSSVVTRRAFAEAFCETPDFARAARVQVYAEAYFWRLYEVAVDQHPVTAWLVGGPRFHDFITDFVLAHPSSTPDIRGFAAGIATALRAHPLAQAHPGIGDVAAVDWAISDTLHRPDEARLSAAALRSVPAHAWPGARFGITKTATLCTCVLPYSQLRQAWAQQQPVPEFDLAPRTVLVWRQANHEVYQRTLRHPEARALGCIASGGTFAEACDAAAGPRAEQASPADVAGWVRRWLDDDLFVSLELS